MELKSKRLTLREITLSDSAKVHELHSLPETDKFNTMGIPENIESTTQLVSEWIACRNEEPVKRYVFCIEDTAGEFLGLSGLIMGKPRYKKAEVWFKIFPEYWNQGYTTEAVNRILQFCFTELKLHRVEAGCAVGNLASKRVLEKVGMLQEGLFRKNLPIRGEWVDNFEFAILETEFKKDTPKQ